MYNGFVSRKSKAGRPRKLSEEQELEIKQKLASSEMTIADACLLYKVAPSTIYNITRAMDTEHKEATE